MTDRHGYMGDLFDTAPREPAESEKSYGFAADGTELKWFHFAPPPYVNPDAMTEEKMRVKVHGHIDELRAADAIPFSTRELHSRCGMWPFRMQWFDKKERKALTVAFEAELRRLLPEDHPNYWQIARIHAKV